MHARYPEQGAAALTTPPERAEERRQPLLSCWRALTKEVGRGRNARNNSLFAFAREIPRARCGGSDDRAGNCSKLPVRSSISTLALRAPAPGALAARAPPRAPSQAALCLNVRCKKTNRASQRGHPTLASRGGCPSKVKGSSLPGGGALLRTPKLLGGGV